MISISITGSSRIHEEINSDSDVDADNREELCGECLGDDELQVDD